MERILRLLMSLEICPESTLMKSCWCPPHIQMKGVYGEKKSALSTTRKHKGVYFLVRPYTAQKHYIRRHNTKRELQRKIIHRYYIACVSVVVGVSRYTTTIYRRTSLDEALSRLSSCVLMWRGAPSFRGLLLYSAHLTTQFSIMQGGLRAPQLLKFLYQ